MYNCYKCDVEMILDGEYVINNGGYDDYTGVYRCPKCGMDEFQLGELERGLAWMRYTIDMVEYKLFNPWKWMLKSGGVL